ncbi:Bax inhibitor-1 family protein [Pseudomonas sp. Marseille-QA0892]
METVAPNEARDASGVVHPALYNLLIGLLLSWGLGLNWLVVVSIDAAAIAFIDSWIVLIGFLAIGIVGANLVNSGAPVAIRFLGYTLLVLSFGLIVNDVVSDYDARTVAQAIRVTVCVTLGMAVLGTCYPTFFDHWIGAILGAWLILFLTELALIVFLGSRRGEFDWMATAVICAFIGYEWSRAGRRPKTLGNAIHSAALLYLDMLQLFLRLLRIFGRRK